MQNEILILDYIGTFAFACYGSYFALKKNFDLFGIFVCAFLTAVGGGTIREIILGNIPFYFYNSIYIIIIIVGIIFTIITFKHFQKINNFMLFLDSLGLITFAFIGASKALGADLGLFGIIFFSTITSVGGGILRDIVMNEQPEVMSSDFYATVAIIFGFFYRLGKDFADNFLWINFLLILCLIIRIYVITKKINLRKPKKSFDIKKIFNF